MTEPLLPTITRAGLAAARKAQMDGLQATIAAVAIGRGKLVAGERKGYTPTGSETALTDEVARVSILTGSALGGAAGSAPIGFTVLARVPALAANAQPYAVQEVGYFLDDGTLLAIWSDPDFPLGFRTALAAFDLRQDLYLQALPTASLAITVLEPDIPETIGVLAELVRGLAVQSRLTVRHHEILTLTQP